MHVRPTAVLVGDENQAPPADSGPLFTPEVSPAGLIVQTYIPPWYCTCPYPLVGEQVALYHVRVRGIL